MNGFYRDSFPSIIGQLTLNRRRFSSVCFWLLAQNVCLPKRLDTLHGSFFILPDFWLIQVKHLKILLKYPLDVFNLPLITPRSGIAVVSISLNVCPIQTEQAKKISTFLLALLQQWKSAHLSVFMYFIFYIYIYNFNTQAYYSAFDPNFWNILHLRFQWLTLSLSFCFSFGFMRYASFQI